METKEKVAEALDEQGITDIQEAIEFLAENDGVEDVRKVNVKWEVDFGDREPYKFPDDESLIEFAQQERDKIMEAENGDMS